MGHGGKRTGAGRKAGSKNKLTMKIRDAIENAFEEVGGQAYLVQVAKDDPRTFVALLSKIIPAEVNAKIGGYEEITVVRTGINRPPGDD